MNRRTPEQQRPLCLPLFLFPGALSAAGEPGTNPPVSSPHEAQDAMDNERPELLALLQACKEEPEEAPRLVLADWLEEHGAAAPGQLIRLQCRAARMSL